MKRYSKFWLSSLFILAFPFISYGADYFVGGTLTCNSVDQACNRTQDESLTTVWTSNLTLPAIWKYDFGSTHAKKVTEIKINGYADASHSLDIIKDFTIAGSDNDSSWTTLQTVTNFARDDAWKTYTLTSTDYFRYYRVNITSNYRADSYAGFAEIEASACLDTCADETIGSETTTATATNATSTDSFIGSISFGLGIIIVLLFIIIIIYIFNSITPKKPWLS